VLVFMNQSFSEPIEDIHWEIETPTTLGNLIRQNWVGPLFIWIVFDGVAIGVLRDQIGSSRLLRCPSVSRSALPSAGSSCSRTHAAGSTTSSPSP